MSKNKNFAPLQLRDLKGLFKVHYDGDYYFNVLCEDSKASKSKLFPSVSSIEYNECRTPLTFKFLPQDNQSKLPKWFVSHFSFTCEVDDEAYVGIYDGPNGKRIAGTVANKIRWLRCKDGDDLCVWTRHSSGDSGGKGKNLKGEEKKKKKTVMSSMKKSTTTTIKKMKTSVMKSKMGKK